MFLVGLCRRREGCHRGPSQLGSSLGGLAPRCLHSQGMPIDASVAELLTAQLFVLVQEAPDPIFFYINSTGIAVGRRVEWRRWGDGAALLREERDAREGGSGKAWTAAWGPAVALGRGWGHRGGRGG